MHQSTYTFNQLSVTRYTFTSVGRRVIKKIVDFEDLGMQNTFNLCFGDLQPDGSVSDQANSNNGDIVKVLATVIAVISDFTMQNPSANVAFTGSTAERIKLYARILKSNFSTFTEKFTIIAFVGTGMDFKEVAFDPKMERDFKFFLIRRII